MGYARTHPKNEFNDALISLGPLLTGGAVVL